MALLISDVAKAPKATLSGGRLVGIFSFTTDAAYAAGGYSVTPAMLGLTTIEQVIIGPSSGYVPEYDYTNSKLKIMQGDYTNAAAAPLLQVPNSAAGINGVVFRGIVIGMM